MISCFVSPHGFGHATRTIAVLEALAGLAPGLSADIYTTVPESLFRETLKECRYRSQLVDIGLVQTSALAADLNATIDRLDRFYAELPTLVDQLAESCQGSSFILCDIAPIGILVAERLNCPSVLIENFTWDWIYAPASGNLPALAEHSKTLAAIFNKASFRLQTEPLCQPAPRALLCPPIYRQASFSTLEQLRTRLSCDDRRIVLVTMGGVQQDLPNWPEMEAAQDFFWIITGQQQTSKLADNILLLGRNSGIYHPDLTCLADLVVCKAGYSSVAECCQAGARTITVGRADFPETVCLQSYAEKTLKALSLTPESFLAGNWLNSVEKLIALPRPDRQSVNGAEVAARFLHRLL